MSKGDAAKDNFSKQRDDMSEEKKSTPNEPEAVPAKPQELNDHDLANVAGGAIPRVGWEIQIAMNESSAPEAGDVTVVQRNK